jgi:hypothetical protein
MANPPAAKWSAEQTRVALIAAAAVVGGVLLHYYAPATLHLPGCPFYQLTGLYCPGCGSTRAIHHLMNFELATAFRCNPMLIIFIPFLTAWFGSRALRTFHLWKGAVFNVSPKSTWALTAIMISWFIVRNLPFAWFKIPLQ